MTKKKVDFVELRVRISVNDRELIDKMMELLHERGAIKRRSYSETIRYAFYFLRNAVLKQIEMERYANE